MRIDTGDPRTPTGRWVRVAMAVVAATVLQACSSPAASVGDSAGTVQPSPTADEPVEPSDHPTDSERRMRFGNVSISAELRPDGSLHVVENREFIFQGTYQDASYELPRLSDDQDVTLSSIADDRGVEYRPGACSPAGPKDPGTFEVDHDPAFRVTWCWDHPPTNTSRRVTLDYTVANAGVRHADSSELYWQFLGDGWDAPTESLIIGVGLPSRDVQFWAHGPPNSAVTEQGPGVIRLAVDDLPPNTFVELRALMPAEALGQVASDGTRVRDQILSEEAGLAPLRTRLAGRSRDEATNA